MEYTTVVNNDELSCKAICDLIDSSAEDFYYVPSEQLGYVTFKTRYELYDFCDRITDIKGSVLNMYNSYNCNDL